MIEEAVRARLLADAGVQALIDTRVYPVILPQQPTLPAVTFQLISEQRPGRFGGPSGLPGSLVQIQSWSGTYRGAKSLARAIRLSLDGFVGTVGGETIQASTLENETDNFDIEPNLKLYCVLQELRVWWNES